MESELHTRIKSALAFLQDGGSFSVGDLRLIAVDAKTICVSGWSRWLNYENITKDVALEELYDIKVTFGKMLLISHELSDFARDKTINYELSYSDSGKCSIGICSEIDGVLSWQGKFRV